VRQAGSQELERPLIDMSEIQLCNSLFCLRVAMVERKSEKGKKVHRLAQWQKMHGLCYMRSAESGGGYGFAFVDLLPCRMAR
jgi:hypothetical protein